MHPAQSTLLVALRRDELAREQRAHGRARGSPRRRPWREAVGWRLVEAGLWLLHRRGDLVASVPTRP